MGAGTPVDGVLLLDKSPGITSTRALAMARRALNASKCGHTGTLDPFATGLLPLVFGEATKFSRFLLDSTKAYEATLCLGQETETGDTESAPRIISEDIPHSGKIAEVSRTFVGSIHQTPPMHSALHIDGKRLYEYAREGLTVDRPARQVHVSSLDILGIEGATLTIRVVCSKGTYIRVLAADMGRAMGCGAYLTALRRTAVGSFRIEDSVTLEDLGAMGAANARTRLLPVETLVAGLPRLDVDGDAETRFRQGQALPATAVGGVLAVFGSRRGFLGVAEVQGEVLAPLRLMAEAAKSPDFA
jgi:tRNA pseudouridine55 synthase